MWAGSAQGYVCVVLEENDIWVYLKRKCGKDPEEDLEGEPFQAEPTARAKGLRQVCAATSRKRKKTTWLDTSESGWMSNMCLNQEEMYFFFS